MTLRKNKDHRTYNNAGVSNSTTNEDTEEGYIYMVQSREINTPVTKLRTSNRIQ